MGTEPARFHWGAFVGVLMIAACLRPAITSVGPLIPRIGADLGLGPAALGLLGAVPLICFAAASALVPALTSRAGYRSTVTIALAGIAGGILLRSAQLPGAIWLGTILVGLAIAIGNVVVAGIVKRDFADRVSLSTGLYAALMGVVAAIASGLSEPLADALGGWRPSLALWAIPTVIALVGWLVVSKRMASGLSAGLPPARAGAGKMWRSRLAWQVTGFMGIQSLSFYLIVTWLPTMAASLGYSSTEAGWLLFAFQIIGVVSGPVVAAYADRLPDQRWLCAAPGLAVATVAAGAILFPGLAWLWVLVAGASSGASFSLSLALPALRTKTPAETVRLSGMAQSVGYLIATLGPIAAGEVAAATNWGVVVAGTGVLALLQAALGAGAGANRPQAAQAKVV